MSELNSSQNAFLFQSITDLSTNYMKCASSPPPCSVQFESTQIDSIQTSSSQSARQSVQSKHSVQTGRLSSLSVASCIQPSFISDIEAAILRSDRPISVIETEEITAAENSGVWANRLEVNNWKGDLALTEYQINVDPNPEVIIKKYEQDLIYVQELAVRYLRPPAAPAPGDILITQEPNILLPPAPPLVIRQQPLRPCTPEPLVVREAPPKPPKAVGQKIITISGKRLPPPPRKVIVERMAPVPSKPQAVITERWLPYQKTKRRVIFQAAPPDPVYCKTKNLIIQWETPNVVIKQEVKYLGVVTANPEEYVKRYGKTLRAAHDLPEISKLIPVQEGVVLAADSEYSDDHELEGDIDALRLIDLDNEGLSMYRSYVTGSAVSKKSASVIGSSSVIDASSVLESESKSGSFSGLISARQSSAVASVVLGSSSASAALGSSSASAALGSSSTSAALSSSSATASVVLGSSSASAALGSSSTSAALGSSSASAALGSSSASAALGSSSTSVVLGSSSSKASVVTETTVRQLLESSTATACSSKVSFREGSNSVIPVQTTPVPPTPSPATPINQS